MFMNVYDATRYKDGRRFRKGLWDFNHNQWEAQQSLIILNTVYTKLFSSPLYLQEQSFVPLKQFNTKSFIRHLPRFLFILR